MKRLVAVSVVSFLLLLTVTSDYLAICISRTKEDLVRESQFVIRGIVKEMKTAWTDDHSRIYTYVKVEVLEVFKGELGGQSEIVVRLRGGRGPGGDMLVDNQPVLEEDMDVIIHTVLLKNGYFVIRGCEDGAYYVNDGMVTGKSGKVNMTLDQFRKFVDQIINQHEKE
jgi:hypothetical protein